MDISYTFEDNINRDLLFAQFVPSHTEAAPLRASLELQESLIGEIDSQMEGLRRRRRAIAESAALKKALLAPIRRLAPEIMAEIFRWCIDESLNISVKSAPLLLLQVCSQWRRVAVGTPHLWTQLIMQWPEEVVVNPRVIVPMWLQNSRSLPIHIYINASSWLHPKTHSPMQSHVVAKILKYILRSVSSHLERCEAFHFPGQDAELLIKNIYPPDGPIHMPLLKSLEITPPQGAWVNPGPIIAPNLRTLNISDQFLAEICPIHLPYLQSLEILCQGGIETIIHFLDKQDDVSLESFSLSRNSLGEPDSSHLASSIERIFFRSTLKELTLFKMMLIPTDLKKMFVAIPTLQTLYISSHEGHWQMGVGGILYLDPVDTSTWILPRLSSISMELHPSEARGIIQSRAVDYHWALEKLEGFQRLTHFQFIDVSNLFGSMDISSLGGMTHDVDGFLFELYRGVYPHLEVDDLFEDEDDNRDRSVSHGWEFSPWAAIAE